MSSSVCEQLESESDQRVTKERERERERARATEGPPKDRTFHGRPRPSQGWLGLATPEKSNEQKNYEFYHFQKNSRMQGGF